MDIGVPGLEYVNPTLLKMYDVQSAKNSFDAGLKIEIFSAGTR